MHATDRDVETFLDLVADIRAKSFAGVWLNCMANTSADMLMNSRCHAMLTTTVLICANNIKTACKVLYTAEPDSPKGARYAHWFNRLEKLMIDIKAAKVPDGVDIYAVTVLPFSETVESCRKDGEL